MADVTPLHRPLAANYSDQISNARAHHPSSASFAAIHCLGELIDMDDAFRKLAEAGCDRPTLQLVRPKGRKSALYVLRFWDDTGAPRSFEGSTVGTVLRRAHAATTAAMNAGES